jgi:hypothetical protein
MLQAQGEAHHQQLQSTFLAAISHDLRTPLAAIVGAASSLLTQRDKLAPPEQERLLRSIASEAAYLSTVTENTLQLVRLSGPAQSLRRDWESLEEIVARSWRVCASATLAAHQVQRARRPATDQGRPGAAGAADRQPAGQRADLQRGADRAGRERPCPRAGGEREGPRPGPERCPAGQPVCASCARRPSGRARRGPGPGRVQGHRRGAWRAPHAPAPQRRGQPVFRCCCPWKARSRTGRRHDAARAGGRGRPRDSLPDAVVAVRRGL